MPDDPPAVAVVGSVHMDLIATAPRLPLHGETLPGTRFAMHPGGKGGNQATQVALMGVPARFIGRVGRDPFGDQLRAALLAKGVDIEHLGIDPDIPTGVSTVLAEDHGDYASVVVPAAGLRLTPRLVQAARPAIAASNVLLAQLELAPATIATAVALGRALAKLVILNAAPAPAPLPAAFSTDFWHAIDLLVVNAGEAALLAHPDQTAPGETARPAEQGLLAHPDQAALPTDPPTAAALAAHLRQRLGVGAAIVTIGAAGSVVADAAGTRHLPGHPATVVDTIGAGDAFTGALAAQLATGTPLDQALTVATAAGALAVTKAGAHDALPTAAAIAARLAAFRPDSAEEY